MFTLVYHVLLYSFIHSTRKYYNLFRSIRPEVTRFCLAKHGDHRPPELKRQRTFTPTTNFRQGFSKSRRTKFDWLSYNSLDNSMACRLCHQQHCEGLWVFKRQYKYIIVGWMNREIDRRRSMSYLLSATSMVIP